MTEGIERLGEDLEVLQAMVKEMPAYLSSDVLFWPMFDDSYPRLTPGGYLVRQHRLLALSHLLNEEQRRQLDEIVAEFDTMTSNRIVRFEEKATQDLKARMREWQEHLEGFTERETVSEAHYASAVQSRATIAALVDKLDDRPYRLDPDVPGKVRALDRKLRSIWKAGEFVWPPEWTPAYPRNAYWWLYGQAQGWGDRQHPPRAED